jgi:hypothetical protein
MIDNDIVIRIKQACQSSLKITERRFAMLLNMEKAHRQWNYQDVVESWTEAIKQFKDENKTPLGESK